MKCIDLIGQKFGILIVVKRVENSQNGHARWLCQCDCGNFKEIQSDSLRTGNTKSCGCRERQKHGLYQHPLYTRWKGIKNRCYNRAHNCYKNYGGRGISICKEWLNDFKSFYNWAIENGYEKELQIDRINNNGNYEPHNCRFVTNLENQKNKT